MADQTPDRPNEGHPIVAGLAALVGVGLVIGLILAAMTVAGARLLGLDDGSSGGMADSPSMYVPPLPTAPTETGGPTGPTGQESTSPAEGGQSHSASPSPRKQISLSASSTSVGPMEPFDLTGVYPGGEGAILQVQRFTNGHWQSFPVTTSVGNETFSTSVQTSQTGVNRFRVIDTDTKLASNPVRVTIR